MLKLDKLNQYILGDNFTTVPNLGKTETPSDTDVSIFFNPQDLFKEGVTEKEFVEAYEQLMAGSFFNTGKDETGISFDLSSIPEDELSNIEETAKKYFKSIDKDANGILSEEEVNEFAGRDGDASFISDEDIKSLTEELFSEDQPVLEQPINTPQEVSTPVSGGSSVSGAGSSGGSHNVNNNSNNYNNISNNASNTQELTLDELKKQRTEKQTELNTARNNLKTVYSEGDKDVNAAKEEYDEAVQNDENISDELKKEQQDNSTVISDKEKEIGGLKSELVDVNGNIDNYKSVISSKNSEIEALKSALSNLNGSTEDVQEQKAEILQKISQAESERDKAQDNLNTANTRKEKIEKEISDKEKELANLETKKAEIEAQISANCSQTTKDALSKYREAKVEADKTVKEAEKNIETLQKEIEKLDKQINKKQSNKIQEDYRQTKLNKKYTLNGKEYLSLFSQDELNRFLSGEWQRGNYNHDSNCLEMSNVYCKDIIKQLNLSARNSYDYINDSQEAVEQKAREVLDSGYPVTLHVSTKRGTRHFATAVGYRMADNGKIEFLLADNVLGVGISACGENGYRHLITGYSTPYANQNYGYRCLYYM